MAELTADEIQYIKNQKAINDYKLQIEIIKTGKEEFLIAKDNEKQIIIAEKDTAIQVIQVEIDKLNV